MNATRIDRGSTDTTTIYSDGGDLTFERTFDAPRELVWKAFTDPNLVPRWWGPHGTTTTVAEMDVRPGGAWRYVSRAADRDDVTFYGEYLEVDPPKSFKWTFMFDVEGVGRYAKELPLDDDDATTRPERDDHLRDTELGQRFLVEPADKGQRLLLGELQHGDITQERRLRLGLKHERPGLGRPHQPLAVEGKPDAELCKRGQRLGRELASKKRPDMHPVGLQACNVVGRPRRAELANVHRTDVAVV